MGFDDIILLYHFILGWVFRLRRVTPVVSAALGWVMCVSAMRVPDGTAGEAEDISASP